MAGTAGKAIHYKGMDGVLKGYKLHNTPYYALYQGKQILFTNDDGDNDVAENLLKENLQGIQESQSTALYTICFYKDLPKGFIDKNTPESGSFNFRICDPAEVGVYQGAATGKNFNPAERYFDYLERKNDMLEQALQDMQEMIEELKEEKEGDDKSLGMIGKLESNDLKDIVKEGVTFLRELFFQNRQGGYMNQQQYQQPAQGISGVNERRTDLSSALKDLASVYIEKNGEAEGNALFVSDMCKLAWLARNKPVSFKNALEQLREL